MGARIQVLMSCAVIVVLWTTSDVKADDAPQVAVIRQMQKVLKNRDWERFYADHCHSQLQKQLDVNKFKTYMDSNQGKAVVELFDRVLTAIDTQANETELIGRSQKDHDEYEFILVRTSQMHRDQRLGQQWHLELKVDKGQWKLLDTD